MVFMCCRTCVILFAVALRYIFDVSSSSKPVLTCNDRRLDSKLDTRFRIAGLVRFYRALVLLTDEPNLKCHATYRIAGVGSVSCAAATSCRSVSCHGVGTKTIHFFIYIVVHSVISSLCFKSCHPRGRTPQYFLYISSPVHPVRALVLVSFRFVIACRDDNMGECVVGFVLNTSSNKERYWMWNFDLLLTDQMFVFAIVRVLCLVGRSVGFDSEIKAVFRSGMYFDVD